MLRVTSLVTLLLTLTLFIVAEDIYCNKNKPYKVSYYDTNNICGISLDYCSKAKYINSYTYKAKCNPGKLRALLSNFKAYLRFLKRLKSALGDYKYGLFIILPISVFIKVYINLTKIISLLDLFWRNKVSLSKVMLGLPGCLYLLAGDTRCSGEAGILFNSEILDLIYKKKLRPKLYKDATIKII
ncbi:hypothetical protein HZ326_29716 [Fusarium oxysporum f. sp. albedinis]|nr:hypothetical protein HZ326_29716 [Fusarium oxysporum f. sp. albedinis]